MTTTLYTTKQRETAERIARHLGRPGYHPLPSQITPSASDLLDLLQTEAGRTALVHACARVENATRL